MTRVPGAGGFSGGPAKHCARLIHTRAGSPVTTHFEETRVWQRIGGKWRHVHIHRSPAGG